MAGEFEDFGVFDAVADVQGQMLDLAGVYCCEAGMVISLSELYG